MADRKKLFVDLGHSAAWAGASGFISEVSWNRKIYPYFLQELDQQFWEVILVPDEFKLDLSANMNLTRRINWINARATEKDYLISIHGNAASRPDARGVTTCYIGGSDFARIEATKLSQAYSEATGVPLWSNGEFADTRSRHGRLGMVRDTKPFALLIEAGFVTNQADMAIAPVAAARGIANYYNSYNPNFKKTMPDITADQEAEKFIKLFLEKGFIKTRAGLEVPMVKRESIIMAGRILEEFQKMLVAANLNK